MTTTTTTKKRPLKIEDCHCVLCGKVWMDGINEAMEEGATPGFWLTESESVDGPVCDGCDGKYLKLDEDTGEFVVRPGAEREVRKRVSHIERRAARFRAGVTRAAVNQAARRGPGRRRKKAAPAARKRQPWE